MKDFNQFKIWASKLYQHVGLTWQEHGIALKSELHDENVPQLTFPSGVEIMVNEVHCYANYPGYYIRECQVEYEGKVYTFEVTSKEEQESIVVKRVEVYTPAGDGFGGLHLLLTEKFGW